MKHSIKIAVIAICFSVTAGAQNIKEGIQNTKQIQEGKKNLERDVNELKEFNLKLNDMKKAVSEKNQNEVDRISKELIVDMTREVSQSSIKAQKAQKEIAQSSAEIRSDRREIRDNKDDSKRGRYDRRDDQKDMARDQANMRDDKRDRRDDIRDFQQQIDRAKSQAVLLKTLKDYDYTVEDIERETYVIKKSEIKKSFKAFMVLLKGDIDASKKELAEDMREQREDSRERRDDRNERNEKDFKRKRN